MRNVKYISLLFGVAGAVFLAFVILFSHNAALAPQREPLPILGQAPKIALTSQEDASFDSALLADKVWIADFFFTSCAGPCPIMSAAISKIQLAFPTEQRLHFVSISVDPETDTPERLRAYGEKYAANFERWHFLTGPIEEISRLAVDGFKVGSVDQPIIHSTRFILVDQQGQIRGYYTGTDDLEVLEMERAIQQLLTGAPA
ncbi:MAG: SCO family protein [Candidatus Hydrogenedentes bacterium]|nr:SCO family protein [Candidatus Hydrogenedentota bacterium]